MGSKSAFFKEFLKSGKMVGSVFPSSRFLQKKMIRRLDLAKAKCIVELGPGEGCITHKIIEKMGPETHLFCFEMHKPFVDEFLQFGNPNIHVIQDSAEFIGKYLNEAGFHSVDYVISSLPLTNFPVQLKETILDESIRLLNSDGIYMQYQYTTSAYRMLKRKFKKVKMGFTPINIPPAFVYTCFP